MNIVNCIDPQFIVNLDKFAIGLPHAEVIETKGKYIVFRAHMAIDNNLYPTCGCTVVDDSFVEKIIGVFTDNFLNTEKESIQFAIDNKVTMLEVDEFTKYYIANDCLVNARMWRNMILNKLNGTLNKMYPVNPPPETYFERLKEGLSYGEYRLGVFTN